MLTKRLYNTPMDHYAPQPPKYIRQQQSCPQGCTPKFRRSYGDNGAQIGIARAPEMQPHIIAREAEGPIGIHNQVTGTHRGILGPMLSGQNQSLINPAKPVQVITGFTPRYAGRGIFPKAHLNVFPSPSI